MKKNKEKDNKDCSCPYNCIRHNDCKICQTYHHKRNEKTVCGK